MGFIFILVYLAIVLAVIEINVIIFTLTGLEKHIARFQVISMLTGTGFTTGESELIIGHPIRRRVGAFLILFGAFSLAVVISAISSILSDNFRTKEIASIAGFLLLALIILKIPPLQKKIARFFKGELKKNFDLKDLPIRDVLMTNEEDNFLEVPIHQTSHMIGQTLVDKITDNEDINIMFIKRGDIVIRKKRLNTKLQAGDKIVLYGDKELMKDKFEEEIEKAESDE
ncbi:MULTISPECIES: TrkA C-terminal domain-containing protein [unclassified Bacillus (in: firmicutes)]|uniref:TrkA C-terminal domain-containing protein n=1 Tax=unclassified Bacillus (in: firmicutes) TaxID=185979 RepID=UPI0008EC043E|nr:MULTISPECIES: TrkA C-terminal domain-containing protein [unclassified Bacillus (in: firmicutes)]SFB08397.1 TrkA-C domain-containing protein [Bacillus sp. UNCCL13]SFQ87081.1 TrkA-C domain-containing protein [Bacillus sp. cl95]